MVIARTTDHDQKRQPKPFGAADAREVRAARGRLEPWKNTHAVRELDERLGGVGLGDEFSGVCMFNPKHLI